MSLFKWSSIVMASVMTVASTLAHTQTNPPVADDQASSPKTLKLMQGFPPFPDQTIKFEMKSAVFPYTRWSFSHMRELVPTKNVWRGAGAPSALPKALDNSLGTRVTWLDDQGASHTFDDMLAMTYTDGVLVLHRGKVVYERYNGEMSDHTPHLAMSVTKSFIGTLASILVHEGKLDEKALVVQYLPEMRGTAYEDATVRQVMDMQIGVKYSELYSDPNAEIWDYARAAGALPKGPNYQGPATLYEFLIRLQKEGEHGKVFDYKTVNTEVLAWLVRRVTGQSTAALLSERIWQPMGAEMDAYFVVDAIGTEQGGGGLNTSLRDLARFGELMRLNGKFNGKQIIPEAVIADIRRGGDAAKFSPAGYKTLPSTSSYRSMWWIYGDQDGVFEARGIHGQRIYINPRAELVVVRYGSHPVAANAANDVQTIPALKALSLYLSQSSNPQ